MKFFLIDDEYISCFINKKLITAIDSSINAIEFTDPEKAYNSLKNENPDLIFLDINMPVMNGWDFLNKMRAEGIFFDVVILSSSVDASDIKKSLNYENIIGYVEKPATKVNMLPYVKNKVDASLLGAAC